MTSTIGIPIKLLNEAQGHVVTLEITSGQVYRGKLLEAEDNMNVQLKDITVTARDGRVSHLDQVYIRGSHKEASLSANIGRDGAVMVSWAMTNFRWSRNAPMFRSRTTKGRGVGLARGRATLLVAQTQVLWIFSKGLTFSPGLTGSAPSVTADSIAGSTHDYPIKTNYYTATIPIWLDEVSEPQTWSKEFLAPEAREVLTVLGGFIVCFRKPVDEAGLQETKVLLGNVAEVVKEGCGYMWDGVCLAVAMPQSTTPCLEKSFDEWEDLCQEHGFEYIDFESKGRNEFSEPMGIERLKEALEANDWDGGNDLGDDLGLDDIDGDDDDEKSVGFGLEAAEMEMEMFGMKQAIAGEPSGSGDVDEDADQADEVDQLEALMLRMQAVRDMGADLPEAERKKFAAKAVSDLMKTL
ncbi:putative small nuclear ribonucleo SM D3 protein [Rutstroemia sp. NJR-2017a BBW]|nr:putative small nuclear ribonucleo SM D3 protein [Rutstroemia sp. NJR-2017a BBW]